VVEVKGYVSEQWNAKHVANPDVVCLGAAEMKPFLEYAMAVHGKDFIKLYENV
jgi:hypothetical protein